MHEVEVKAPLHDKDAFITALAGHGCELGPVITQDDTVFVHKLGSLEIYLQNQDFLRLRVEDSGRVLFAFKHHPTRVTNLQSAPLELELEVASRETMQQILGIMGYQEAVRIKKQRRVGHYKNWEVCVDEVEGLGSFVEFEELIPENENVAEIQARMGEFLKELGVYKEEQLKHRYDVMLIEKKGFSTQANNT